MKSRRGILSDYRINKASIRLRAGGSFLFFKARAVDPINLRMFD
jgi:hypothetical protein